MVMVKVMATKEMIKCLTFGKEEREKKYQGDQGKDIMIGAIFVCTEDTIEGVGDLGSIAIL